MPNTPPSEPVESPSQTPPLKRSFSPVQMEPPGSIKRLRSSPESRTSDIPVHNRIHRRVITRDAGKTIYKASSLIAVVNGLVGAIKGERHSLSIENLADLILGHQSLLEAGILHRDISTGNIMLTEQEDDGFLIDMDLAIHIDKEKSSGAPRMIGTKVFMAIGALLGHRHTPLHDLESFFWVTLWICIHWNGLGQKRQKVKEFDDWNTKPIKELATLKMGLVSKLIFYAIEDSFTSYCKRLFPCLSELHGVMFPGGAPCLTEDRQLYHRLVRILEKAKRELS